MDAFEERGNDPATEFLRIDDGISQELCQVHDGRRHGIGLSYQIHIQGDRKNAIAGI